MTSEPSLKSRLREKLPDLALEVICIVFAVLLALGIDAWRDRSGLQSESVNALNALRAEANSNWQELEKTLEGAEQSRERLREFLSRKDKSGDLKLGFTLALMSSANWQMAQQMPGFLHVDFGHRAEWAQRYELQMWVADAQRRAFTSLNALSSLDADNDDPRVRESMRQLLQDLDFFCRTGRTLLLDLEKVRAK